MATEVARVTSENWKTDFLTVLAATRNQTMALRAVGITLSKAKYARDKDEEFSQQWEAILPKDLSNRNPMPAKPMNKPGIPVPPGTWEEEFLQVLADTQLIGEACKAANISRAHAYRIKKENKEFGARWEEIFERGTDLLEQIAIRRAAESSDQLMMFLLKARRPEVYNDKVDVHHDHIVQGSIALVDGRNPVEYDSKARREAARLLQENSKDDEEVIEGNETGQ